MSYHPLLATLLPSADVAYLVPYGTLTGALDEHLFLFGWVLATKEQERQPGRTVYFSPSCIAFEIHPLPAWGSMYLGDWMLAGHAVAISACGSKCRATAERCVRFFLSFIAGVLAMALLVVAMQW